MEYGKDFVSALMDRSEKAVSLNEKQMYTRQGYFVTRLLLLLNTNFVMTLDRIEKHNSSFESSANGSKLNRTFNPRNDKEHFKDFVSNKEWSYYQVAGENLDKLYIDQFSKEMSSRKPDSLPRKKIGYYQLFKNVRNALAHGQAYPMSTSEAVIFPENLNPEIQSMRETRVIDRVYFMSQWKEKEKPKNVKGVNLFVCTNQALFDFWNGWKALIKQDFKEEALGEQKILSRMPPESTIHAEPEKVIGYGD
jgi:hypothetical protein